MARENKIHAIFAFGSMYKDVFCKNNVCGTVSLSAWSSHNRTEESLNLLKKC